MFEILSLSSDCSCLCLSVVSRRFDQFMFENDDMLIVVAAGNDGHDDAPKTIDSPGLGKNVLTVGSHLSFKTSLFGGHHGGQLSDLSSRGPTVDGRTKPDIISVGEYLLSAGARPDIVGECDPSDGSIPRVTTTNDGLASKRGTSMATPVVSGTAAIVRQYFEEGYYPTGVQNESNSHDPTGALIKAVLLNGAQNLYFVDNSKHTEIKPHDNNQGFGRMSLQDSVYIPGSTNVQLSVWDKEFIRNGETREFDVVIDETGGCKAGQLSATLVWLEPASVSGCKRCVLNDLDLTVVIGNTTYFPNALDSPDLRNACRKSLCLCPAFSFRIDFTLCIELRNCKVDRLLPLPLICHHSPSEIEVEEKLHRFHLYASSASVFAIRSILQLQRISG